jgi:hypothetical protein
LTAATIGVKPELIVLAHPEHFLIRTGGCMEPEYDIFEIRTESGLFWRKSIRGTQNAIDALAEIGQTTDNECFATDLETQQVLAYINIGRARAQILEDDRNVN